MGCKSKGFGGKGKRVFVNSRKGGKSEKTESPKSKKQAIGVSQKLPESRSGFPTSLTFGLLQSPASLSANFKWHFV